MKTDQVYAALSPVSGILMYAALRADLATAITTYAQEIGASPREAADEVEWYKLPSFTEIEGWDHEWDDDQRAEWDAANPRQIPDHLVADATREALARRNTPLKSDLHSEGLYMIDGTMHGKIAVYLDEATDRFYLADVADVMEAGRIGDYSLWCDVVGGVGEDDGYEDEDDAIADALHLQTPAEVAS
jgi:hypothetical protein